MAWGSKKGGGGPAWLALLVAVVALWIAWSAYRRTGGTLDTLVANPLNGAPASAPPAEAEAEGGNDWRAALDRARERLVSRRDEVQEDRDLDAVQRDIAEIRASLEKAWHGAGEAKEKWQDLDGELDRLQAQLRDKSSQAKETLDGLVQRMKNAT